MDKSVESVNNLQYIFVFFVVMETVFGNPIRENRNFLEKNVEKEGILCFL